MDHHTDDEFVYIVEGVVLENGRAYGPGSYFRFLTGSSHRPATEVGVTMFGTNVKRR